MNTNTQNELVRIKNPLGNDNQVMHSSPAALVTTESQRAIAEVQAALAIAKSFPRDRIAAVDRILNDCQRSGLAEVAVYQYYRGGASINGPTIRLAESLAQNWGNIQYGVRELSQANGESTVEAFAWDVETNTRQTKVFQVPHIRHTQYGQKKLTDPRDIYELVANNGARRLRACILGVIPGDIVEAALQQCEATLSAYADTSPEGIQKILKAFEKIDVSKEAIEKRIQCRIDAIKPAQIVSLTKIGTSIKEGMSVASDWFDMSLGLPQTKQVNEEITAFEAIKRQILVVKTNQDLDLIEEKALDHENSDERKQLIKMIRAQREKFTPVQVAAAPIIEKEQSSQSDIVITEQTNVTTSEESLVSKESKPEPKKKNPLDVRKQYLFEINQAETIAELNELYERFIIDDRLNETQISYLKDSRDQKKQELQKAAEPKVKEKLMTKIENATSIEELKKTVAPQMTANKDKLTEPEMQVLRQAYADKTHFIESQMNLLESWIDGALARIAQAQNIDDIHAEYTDPAYDELSDTDKQRFDLAAQKHEAELQH